MSEDSPDLLKSVATILLRRLTNTSTATVQHRFWIFWFGGLKRGIRLLGTKGVCCDRRVDEQGAFSAKMKTFWGDRVTAYSPALPSREYVPHILEEAICARGLWNLPRAELRSEKIGATAMPKRVSFLFGSGISIRAGMPSVTDITERVLSGNDVEHHTGGGYYFVEPPPPHFQSPWAARGPDEYVRRVRPFIEKLRDEIKEYYPSRQCNYEDLYYVAWQILYSARGEYDNPLVQAFVDKILPGVEPLFRVQDNDIRRSDWKLYEIAREATDYIFYIVWNYLKIPRTADLNYLNCIAGACRDMDISSVDLFTLNHDTLLEQYLEGQNIKYTAGFESRENGYRYWSPRVFADHSRIVRLFKLHGSVNWFRYESNAATEGNDPVGIADDGRHWLIRDPNGELTFRYHDRPVLLVGTFNKIFEYTSRIFADLFYEFRRSLPETDLLIVSGYGFGDQGINMQVAEWADSSEKAKIVVIHENPEKLRMGARGNIRLRWNGWLANKKLVVIPKWIEHTSWKDIQSAIQRV